MAWALPIAIYCLSREGKNPIDGRARLRRAGVMLLGCSRARTNIGIRHRILCDTVFSVFSSHVPPAGGRKSKRAMGGPSSRGAGMNQRCVYNER